jgi:hypothetical protein
MSLVEALGRVANTVEKHSGRPTSRLPLRSGDSRPASSSPSIIVVATDALGSQFSLEGVLDAEHVDDVELPDVSGHVDWFHRKHREYAGLSLPAANQDFDYRYRLAPSDGGSSSSQACEMS